MQLWKQWLVFSRRERRGVLWLIALNLVFLFIPWAYSQLSVQPRIEQRIQEHHHHHYPVSFSKDSTKPVKHEDSSAPQRIDEAMQKSPSSKPRIIDLNQTDSVSLLDIYGIGPVLAGRIIRFRDALGGFISKEQLWDVYGVSEEFMPEILESVTVEEPALPWVDVNNFSFKELLAHPYVSYDMAGEITNLRYESNLITSEDDLLNGEISDSILLSKLLPYLLYH